MQIYLCNVLPLYIYSIVLIYFYNGMPMHLQNVMVTCLCTVILNLFYASTVLKYYVNIEQPRATNASFTPALSNRGLANRKTD